LEAWGRCAFLRGGKKEGQGEESSIHNKLKGGAYDLGTSFIFIRERYSVYYISLIFKN
jgi:hypothetical protein